MIKAFTYSLILSVLGGGDWLGAEVRPIDGWGNHLKHPRWGAAGCPLQRFSRAYYGDGVAAMAGDGRPGPRAVSNRVASQAALTESDRGLSDMTWCWGQFLDHDISLVLPSAEEFIPVMVGEGDVMAPMIPMMRSRFDPATGTAKDNPRQQVNTITAFVDASMVYGHSEERAAALRAHRGGALLMRVGGMLPWNRAGIEMENPARRPLDRLYMAGDIRANENPALISMHTLWLREHNRWAGILTERHPDWTDEEVYQKARRMVMGEIQAITYQEFLPALLGPYAPGLEEAGYDPEVNPSMFNEVSGALYRIGHTMVSAHIMRLLPDGRVAEPAQFVFKDAFFQPELVAEPEVVEQVLQGVATKRMQEIDPFVVDDLRNFLFALPGQGGMDLIAINLQRGRDHGLPSYNEARVALGLKAVTDFETISSDPFITEALREAYGSVDQIDLWIGAMAEDRLVGASLGETATRGLAMQFRHLRDGDRFFFLWDEGLSESQKAEVRSTTLSEVIQRNTGLSGLQENVFLAPPVMRWADGDGDGVPDIREVIAGTDPRDPGSALRLMAMELGDREVALQWSSVPGTTYLIQQAEALQGPWLFRAEVTAEGLVSHHAAPRLNERAGFYRIIVAH